MAAQREKKTMGQSVPDEAWLAQVVEEALEPDLPIVDPHHHLWVRSGAAYLVPEFAADLASGHNVVSTVYAQCHSMYRQDGPAELRSLGETEFVAGCAAMGASGAFGPARICEAMFGEVDLTLGERARPLFEQHLERSGGRFRGVRYSTAWDASERINNVAPRQHQLVEPEVLAAAGVLADMGLSLDCWLYHPQLDDICTLAAQHPGLTIILNHTGVPILGGPYRDKRDQVFEDWKQGMAAVAAHANVYLKLGALPILRAAGADRSIPPGSAEVAAAWKPWMDYCIETFGPARCMFESNFPVQKLWSSYAVTWNAFKRIAAGASAGEKQALFEGAARAAYRLPSG